MTATPTETRSPVEIIEGLVREYADTSLLIKKVKTEQQAKINAIEKATSEALAPKEARLKEIKDLVSACAKLHRTAIFGKKKSYKVGLHAVSIRSSSKVVIEDEELTIALLQEIRDTDEDASYRVSAAACLKEKVTINKEFIASNWKRFSEWFQTAASIDRETTETVDIKPHLTPAD